MGEGQIPCDRWHEKERWEAIAVEVTIVSIADSIILSLSRVGGRGRES